MHGVASSISFLVMSMIDELAGRTSTILIIKMIGWMDGWIDGDHDVSCVDNGDDDDGGSP